MNKIDTASTYRGEILESALGETKKGFPQSVLRIKALEKWVEDKTEIEFFQKQGLLLDGNPDWVNWDALNEEILAYLVLFNSAEVFEPGQTDLKNYEQLQLATGWTGEEFDSLGNGALVGKKILFRTENNEYQGKVSLQVNWVDAWDAPPNRELKSIDAAAVKTLNSKLRINKTVRPASAPAKPGVVAKPPAPGPSASNMQKMAKAQAEAKAASMAADAEAFGPDNGTPLSRDEKAELAAFPFTLPPEEATCPCAPPPRKASRSKKAVATPPPAPVDDVSPKPSPGNLEVECTQIEGWDYVCTNKGDNSDTDIESAWIASCTEVGGDRDEANFTPADWAKVRDLVIEDLAL